MNLLLQYGIVSVGALVIAITFSSICLMPSLSSLVS